MSNQDQKLSEALEKLFSTKKFIEIIEEIAKYEKKATMLANQPVLLLNRSKTPPTNPTNPKMPHKPKSEVK